MGLLSQEVPRGSQCRTRLLDVQGIEAGPRRSTCARTSRRKVARDLLGSEATHRHKAQSAIEASSVKVRPRHADSRARKDPELRCHVRSSAVDGHEVGHPHAPHCFGATRRASTATGANKHGPKVSVAANGTSCGLTRVNNVMPICPPQCPALPRVGWGVFPNPRERVQGQVLDPRTLPWHVRVSAPRPCRVRTRSHVVAAHRRSAQVRSNFAQRDEQRSKQVLVSVAPRLSTVRHTKSAFRTARIF